MSPRQNGIAPGAPGAGVTSTRSRVISSIRQVDAPSMKVWPGARLVDHLLVELADAAAVGQVDAEEAAVGDRARVGDGELPRALARADRRPRRGPRRSAAAARRTPPTGSARRACRARCRAACGRAPRTGTRAGPSRAARAPSTRRRSRRIATICCASTSSGLRGTTVSSISASRIRCATTARLEQVGAELGEDPALRGLADAVAGAADALQAARDRLRRLDLEHEVDGAHVDAELERGGGDEARAARPT